MNENLLNGSDPLIAHPLVDQPTPTRKTSKRRITKKPPQPKVKVSDTPKLGVYRMYPDVKMPHLATEQSACFDMRAYLKLDDSVTIFTSTNEKIQRPVRYYAAEIDGVGIVLNPGERILMPTGIIFDIPAGYSVRVHPRSGCALKEALTLINGEGVIDSDYVEQGYMPLVNHSSTRLFVRDDDRCTQVEMIENLHYDVEEVLNRPKQKTSRSGGFGHSGK